MMCVRELLLVGVSSGFLAGCGSGGGFPDAREDVGPPPPGTFTLDWSVTDAVGQVISCDSIGAQSVTALLRNPAVSGGSTEPFSCATLEGMSQGVAPGLYDIDFELVGSGGPSPTNIIATAPKQLAVEIVSGSNVPLAPLTFAVNAIGGLKLNLASSATAGNCVATAQGGAGITTMTITLEQASDATCEPVTFTVGAGATSGTPGGTYTVNCATPAITACIESDQQLSVANVPSGSYLIHVRANAAPTTCWANNDSLPVPPLGQDLVRTLNLAVLTATAGC